MWIRILCSFCWGSMIGIFRGGMYPDVTVTTKYSSGSIWLKRGPRPHTLSGKARVLWDPRDLKHMRFFGWRGKRSFPFLFSSGSACAHFVPSAGHYCTWPKREENVSRKSYDLQVNANRCCGSTTTFCWPLNQRVTSSDTDHTGREWDDRRHRFRNDPW